MAKDKETDSAEQPKKRGVDGPIHPESQNKGGIYQDAKGNIITDTNNRRN